MWPLDLADPSLPASPGVPTGCGRKLPIRPTAASTSASPTCRCAGAGGCRESRGHSLCSGGPSRSTAGHQPGTLNPGCTHRTPYGVRSPLGMHLCADPRGTPEHSRVWSPNIHPSQEMPCAQPPGDLPFLEVEEMEPAAPPEPPQASCPLETGYEKHFMPTPEELGLLPPCCPAAQAWPEPAPSRDRDAPWTDEGTEDQRG